MSIITQILNQGGSVANQGMNYASNTLSSSVNTLNAIKDTIATKAKLLNSKISLDMKISELLLNAEAQKASNMLNIASAATSLAIKQQKLLGLKAEQQLKLDFLRKSNLYKEQILSNRAEMSNAIKDYTIVNLHNDFIQKNGIDPKNALSIDIDPDTMEVKVKKGFDENSAFYLNTKANLNKTKIYANLIKKATDEIKNNDYYSGLEILNLALNKPKKALEFDNAKNQLGIDKLAIKYLLNPDESLNALKEKIKKEQNINNDDKALEKAKSIYKNILLASNIGKTYIPNANKILKKINSINNEKKVELYNLSKIINTIDPTNIEQKKQLKAILNKYLDKYDPNDKIFKNVLLQYKEKICNGSTDCVNMLINSHAISTIAKQFVKKDTNGNLTEDSKKALNLFNNVLSIANGEPKNLFKNSNLPKNKQISLSVDNTISSLVGSKYFKTLNIDQQEQILKSLVLGIKYLKNSKKIENNVADRLLKAINLSINLNLEKQKVFNDGKLTNKFLALSQELVNNGDAKIAYDTLENPLLTTEDKTKYLLRLSDTNHNSGKDYINIVNDENKKTIESSYNIFSKTLNNMAHSIDHFFTSSLDINIGNFTDTDKQNLKNMSKDKFSIEFTKKFLYAYNNLKDQTKSFLKSMGYKNPIRNAMYGSKFLRHSDEYAITNNNGAYEAIKKSMQFDNINTNKIFPKIVDLVIDYEYFKKTNPSKIIKIDNKAIKINSFKDFIKNIKPMEFAKLLNNNQTIYSYGTLNGKPTVFKINEIDFTLNKLNENLFDKNNNLKQEVAKGITQYILTTNTAIAVKMMVSDNMKEK